MNVLEKFVKNDFNIDALENLDEARFNINTKDLELVIDANIAANLSKYQHIVSTMYCLGKYGSFDIRKLTLDEKNRLSLKFKIQKGSTDYLANVKEIVEMFINSLPAEHKIWGVIVICVLFWGSFGAYLFYKFKESKLKQSTIIEKEETTRLAIQKLSDIAENNSFARKSLEYSMREEQQIAKNYENCNSNISINGDIYTKEQLEQIVKEYSKRQPKEEVKPTSENIKGKYVVTNIETIPPYRLTLKDNNNNLIKPTYDPEFLDRNMLDNIQKSVSSSIPVEFYFDINISTDSKNQKHYSIIKISK